MFANSKQVRPLKNMFTNFQNNMDLKVVHNFEKGLGIFKKIRKKKSKQNELKKYSPTCKSRVDLQLG